MKFDLNVINEEFREGIKSFRREYDVIPASVVTYSGDGIIKIDGLRDARCGELLELSNGSTAIALNLEENEVGAVVFGGVYRASAGMTARATGKIVEVPVGDALLGRIINPLGEPMDGGGPVPAAKFRPIEAPSPTITDRDKVSVPLHTGIMAIDSMIPIGRGQRELIIGDRQTGKTSIAVDTILNQKGKNVVCIYVSIAQKASAVSSVVNTLTDNDAMGYTCVVCSTARHSAPMQYIAPFAGCAIAEEFMYV